MGTAVAQVWAAGKGGRATWVGQACPRVWLDWNPGVNRYWQRALGECPEFPLWGVGSPAAPPPGVLRAEVQAERRAPPSPRGRAAGFLPFLLCCVCTVIV